MANALKTRGYDFHFRFGTASHSEAQEAMDLPEALTWLWRDYDLEKTSQMFEQEELNVRSQSSACESRTARRGEALSDPAP
jgi:hypothetical protein